jgi:hypothetical protein
MDDRKRYLEMCQINSASPKSVVVEYKGIRYYPEKLVVWFNNGKPKNTARMTAVVGTSGIECDLLEVVCLDKDE